MLRICKECFFFYFFGKKIKTDRNSEYSFSPSNIHRRKKNREIEKRIVDSKKGKKDKKIDVCVCVRMKMCVCGLATCMRCVNYRLN